jgi:hypothetical protein
MAFDGGVRLKFDSKQENSDFIHAPWFKKDLELKNFLQLGIRASFLLMCQSGSSV